MTQQTSQGITYPEAADHTRLWEHLQTLAEDVDALLATVGDVQSGSLSVSTPTSGDTSNPETLTFPRPFASTPNVVVTAMNNAWIANVQTITPTDCLVRITHRLGQSGSGGGVTVQWIAQGDRT